jgi:hypothetical protein
LSLATQLGHVDASGKHATLFSALMRGIVTLWRSPVQCLTDARMSHGWLTYS